MKKSFVTLRVNGTIYFNKKATESVISKEWRDRFLYCKLHHTNNDEEGHVLGFEFSLYDMGEALQVKWVNGCMEVYARPFLQWIGRRPLFARRYELSMIEGDNIHSIDFTKPME